MPMWTVEGAFYANVGVHSAATMLVWALMLTQGDYARAFSYVAAIALLRVPLVVVAHLVRSRGHAVETARLALVCTTCGGAVVGILMCMSAMGVAIMDVAVPMLLVGLNQFDPMALLVAVFAIGGGGPRTEGDGDGDGQSQRTRRIARVHGLAATARVLGTLAGAFLFTGAWITGALEEVRLAVGAALVAAQVPLMPLDAGLCAGAARVSRMVLRATKRGAGALVAVRVALAIDVAVALSLSIAIATWSYQSIALWDRVYSGSVASAWAANAVGIGVLVGAAAVARTGIVSIDSRDPVAAAAAVTSPRAGLSRAATDRLRRRLNAAAAVLGGAVLLSSVLDVSLRTETPLHAVVSLAVACGAILADQLATQVAVRANGHVEGTHLHVQLFYVLGGVRATVHALGFLLGWFWREQLRASTVYALPFAVVCYATTQCIHD